MSDQHDGSSKSTEHAYVADGVTVFFDSKRCIHSANCVKSLPVVFDTSRKPWVDPAQASPEDVARAVERCPSGALQYELTDGPAEAPDVPTRVEPQVDGPIALRGDLRIVLDQGVLTETRATLCRCGRSGNKPFCDKTCERTGWSSTWHPPAE